VTTVRFLQLALLLLAALLAPRALVAHEATLGVIEDTMSIARSSSERAIIPAV